MAILTHFWGKKWIHRPLEPIFVIKEMSKKNQLKIPTLRKIIAAPSGGETKFEKKSLGANSGMFIGTLGENTVSPLSTYVLLKQGFRLK